MITITQGTNSWIASDLTQPYAIAVYPDGTAIRAEDQGILSEPLPEMTIGRLDECRLRTAVAEIQRLAGADLGEATVTDQGTTTITLHETTERTMWCWTSTPSGVGDEFVQPDQRAARQQVTALIDNLTGGHDADRDLDARPGAGQRLRHARGSHRRQRPGRCPARSTGALDQGGRRPCGVFGGADARRDQGRTRRRRGGLQLDGWNANGGAGHRRAGARPGLLAIATGN